MKLKIGEEEYAFDVDILTIREAKEIKRQTGGMTFAEFLNGCLQVDPDALQAAAYLAKTRAGIATRFEDLESLVIMQMEVVDDSEDSAAGDDVDDTSEDPTPTVEVPDGTSTSTKNGTSTSRRSRSGGTSRQTSSTE